MLLKGIVNVPFGILNKGKKGKTFGKLAEALTAETECGFGLDYCNGVQHWLDLSTNVRYVEYMYEGSKVIKPWTNFLTEGPAPV